MTLKTYNRITNILIILGIGLVLGYNKVPSIWHRWMLSAAILIGIACAACYFILIWTIRE